MDLSLFWAAVDVLNTDRAALWAQAIGAVGTLITAVMFWRLDRAKKLREEHSAAKDRLRRIIVALRSEVLAALEAAEGRRVATGSALQGLGQARDDQRPLSDAPAPPVGSFAITSATVYRQVASEIGILPIPLIGDVVKFYERAKELERITGMGTTAEGALRTVQSLVPRLAMTGAILIRKLTKFENAGFDSATDFSLTEGEMREMATQTGYPLEGALRRKIRRTDRPRPQ